MKKRNCFIVLLAVVLTVLPAFSDDEDKVRIPVFPPYAIINASYRGDVEIIQQILASGGVDKDIRDAVGATALHQAMMQPNVLAVKLLLDYGFDPNATTKSGYTPLHFAVAANNLSAARLLLQYGADKRIKNEEGFTPLDKARQAENGPFVSLLR
jgi:ankyrin repeat protein